MTDLSDREALTVWARCLEDYARDWDRTFPQSDFFTEEYWYLFVNAILAAWRGDKFILADAMNKMKSGGPAAKRDRIERAKDVGLLKLEEQVESKGTLVRPTEKLERLMTDHLRRTLADVRQQLRLQP